MGTVPPRANVPNENSPAGSEADPRMPQPLPRNDRSGTRLALAFLVVVVAAVAVVVLL